MRGVLETVRLDVDYFFMGILGAEEKCIEIRRIDSRLGMVARRIRQTAGR